MDAARREIAAEILASARVHDAAKADRLDRFRSLEPETAAMLNLLVRAKRPKRMLEVGTSSGYSTIWLADAAEAVGASFRSVDIDGARTELARSNLARVGVSADLVVQEGGDALHEAPDGFWDFVFLDAERTVLVGYWPELMRTVAPSGLVAIDNVLSHADEVEEVTALIEADPRVTTTLVPVGKGVRLVVRKP
jgi:predicted O-methyltransferase YrrM